MVGITAVEKQLTFTATESVAVDPISFYSSLQEPTMALLILELAFYSFCCISSIAIVCFLRSSKKAFSHIQSTIIVTSHEIQ
jgi:hypothetical protein